MNRPNDTTMFDQRIADWLEDDPSVAPAQIMETVLAAMPSVSQRRGLARAARAWLQPAPRLAYLGLAVIALLLVALIGLALIGRPGPVPREPTPPPTPQRVDAPLHFYSIQLPQGWQGILGGGSQSRDMFFDGPEGRVEITFALIPSGTGQEEWADAWFVEQMAAIPACANAGADPGAFEAQSVGQTFGRLYTLPCLGGWLVLTAVGDRALDIRFVVAAGFDQQEARQRFGQILQGMSFDVGPTPPLALSSFTSSRYGYSVAYPTGWTTMNAARDLGAFEIPWASGDQVDLVEGPPEAPSPAQPTSGILDIAAVTLPPGTTLEEFTSRTAGATCGEGTGAPVPVDGETGNLVEYRACFETFHQWVTVIHEGRGYHIVWLDDPGNEGFDRSVFRQILATFRFPAT